MGPRAKKKIGKHWSNVFVSGIHLLLFVNSRQSNLGLLLYISTPFPLPKSTAKGKVNIVSLRRY